jgi:phage terminase small subunit
MSKRGKKPKPTNLKLLEGNPGKRPLNEREPKPKRIMPVCPGWIKKDAEMLAEWELIGPILFRLGILTEADGPAFAALCFNYCQFERYARKARAGGNRAIDGSPGKGPSFQELARKYYEDLRKGWAMFGMTPSDRTALVVPGGDDVDWLLD